MEIPVGHQAVMPYLMMEDAASFIDFAKDVFDAELTHQGVRENNMIGHCEVRIGGSTIMFSSSRGDCKPTLANMFVYVNNADETYARSLKSGAVTIMEPADQDYGRSCGVTDPFGNVWWITSVASGEENK
jgi:PhnB protein